MTFSGLEINACHALVRSALWEDQVNKGDATGLAVIPAGLPGRAVLVARKPGIIAGLPAVHEVVRGLDVTSLEFAALVDDGSRVDTGAQLGTLSGSMQFILHVERTALNFLQHLSGIATLTRRYVDAIAGLPVQILDTRKTIPGWRLLEKYAVRCGGGHNHRMGLHDGILIKDNHLAALGGGTAAIKHAIQAARRHVGHSVPIEIEVDNLDEFGAALAELPDIILLDNMLLDDMREAARRRKAAAPQVLLEASGGVTLETVRAVAETGVDRISVGALTHSAPALDIALDYLP